MQKQLPPADSQRERAITKLRLELSKDIDRASIVASHCGHLDLLLLCYILRLNKVQMTVSRYRDALSEGGVREKQLYDDSLKYAISLVAKHGNWRTIDKNLLNHFDDNRVEQLLRLTSLINTKFESEILLYIADVQVMGERDKHCKLDLEGVLADPERAMYLWYGLRIERFASDVKDSPLPIEALIDKLRQQYSGIDDLFEVDFGISLGSYCTGMLDLHAAHVKRSKDAEAKLPTNDAGLIDLSMRTFVALAKTMVFTDEALESTISPEFLNYLRSHPFDAAAFSDSELRFHYLTRRPYFIGNHFAILSPDLIFDGLLDNARYTLLESDASKEKYKNRRSVEFIDDIATIALRSGYKEIDRDVYLKKGKDQIGDIDLALYNKETGHTILVEGKNHTLPLAVYFRSPEAIKDHVVRTRDWETKVKRRISHLQSDKSIYPIAGSWDYIIVTQMPEPLSHLSDLLVLSIREFEKWLVQETRSTKFTDFFEKTYKPETPIMSMDEIRKFMDRSFISLQQPE
jgi:hypothetical protein